MAIAPQYMNQSFEKQIMTNGIMKSGNRLELAGLSLTKLPFYSQVLSKLIIQLKIMKLR